VTAAPGPGSGGQPPGDVVEFTADQAGYSWWRNTHNDGYVLIMRRRHAPLLHRARCTDIDPDRHPGRMSAGGVRILCAPSKAALRVWLKVELPEMTSMLERCPKCGP
jgi:hypothetical protein